MSSASCRKANGYAMAILWTTAFVDMPASQFDRGAAFWSAATGAPVSPVRGAEGEFATLLPSMGDPYMRVQRTVDGSSGIHLDLHVESVGAAREHAVFLGAEVVADKGYMIMRSPAGFVFCFVPHHGENEVPDPLAVPVPHQVDQVCLDISPREYDAECTFWHALTGWDLAESSLAEFCALQNPVDLPLRILLQRLDHAPPGQHTHAHLDVACGDHIDQVAAHHEFLGAKRHRMTKRWMQMYDPTGRHYCLTPREPREP